MDAASFNHNNQLKFLFANACLVAGIHQLKRSLAQFKNDCITPRANC